MGAHPGAVSAPRHPSPRRRHEWITRFGMALFSLIVMLAIVVVLGAGSVYGLNEWLVEDAIADCKIREAQGLTYDCEDEGLILVIPIMMAAAAMVTIIFGAVLLRVTRRRA